MDYAAPRCPSIGVLSLFKAKRPLTPSCICPSWRQASLLPLRSTSPPVRRPPSDISEWASRRSTGQVPRARSARCRPGPGARQACSKVWSFAYTNISGMVLLRSTASIGQHGGTCQEIRSSSAFEPCQCRGSAADRRAFRSAPVGFVLLVLNSSRWGGGLGAVTDDEFDDAPGHETTLSAQLLRAQSLSLLLLAASRSPRRPRPVPEPSSSWPCSGRSTPTCGIPWFRRRRLARGDRGREPRPACSLLFWVLEVSHRRRSRPRSSTSATRLIKRSRRRHGRTRRAGGRRRGGERFPRVPAPARAPESGSTVSTTAFFSAYACYVKGRIREGGSRRPTTPSPRFVVFDAEGFAGIDASGVEASAKSLMR